MAQPLRLRRTDIAPGGDIAVQAHKTGERCEECPIHVRLSHCRSERILRLRHFYRSFGAKISYETIQRLVTLQILSVMIPRDREDRTRVKLVGLIELFVVLL